MKGSKPYLIACAVLAVDIKHVAAKLGIDIGLKFLEGGLHNRPNLLREKLQEAIEEVSGKEDCERIILGYGVCGRGSIGIQAGRVPLVIPKVHDCIALFLGGDGPYRHQFKKFPGTYYISAGWYEEKTSPLSGQKKWVEFGEERLHYDSIVEQYGDAAADTTFRFLNSWQKNYQRAAFIETGARISPKYEQHARKMAAEHGWKYEKIPGDQGLIEKMLLTVTSTDEILVVPQGHVIGFDPLKSTLSADPFWALTMGMAEGPQVTVDDEDQGLIANTDLTIGLGIDAGGTYTDAVIYDLARGQTLGKSKALTTKWDFTIGIGKALAGLDQNQLKRVDMVALSTTLATNAIVEGAGQKVGLILMPPSSLADPREIPHEPKAVVKGRLDISGCEIESVDELEIRSRARQMVDKQKVAAFAVSGFAGSINPTHELRVKRIIQQETGMFVTCGHELSNILDFTIRANTALFNGRIIPLLARLLDDLTKTLESIGLSVPMVVVKGDGTLMSDSLARERPVETILSGPAASVAGARYLTRLTDALVVDMGGTTSDTALIEKGLVRLCDSGSVVGGHRTHVKALDIRTAGLGGDSLIRRFKSELTIGPRRVSPIVWLGGNHPGTVEAITFLRNRSNRFSVSTEGMECMVLTGSAEGLKLTSNEKAILALLQERPHSIEELKERSGVLSIHVLSLERLEDHFVIQRCGLTPTDLLHLEGSFHLWSTDIVTDYLRLFAELLHRQVTEMAEELLTNVSERLALELITIELIREIGPHSLNQCSVCKTLLRNMFSGGSEGYRVRIDLKRPVIGIGAPIGYFLPRAAKMLGAKAIIPEDADVANAIGAITSEVVVKRQVRIIPGYDGGGFCLEGLPGAQKFMTFEDADRFAREELIRIVRMSAVAAGTSSRAVTLTTEDQTPLAADGRRVFLGRIIHAILTGPPNIKAHEILLN